MKRPEPFFDFDAPVPRTPADVALRRLLGLLLLVLVLVLAACNRKFFQAKPYHPRKNPPSWAERERTQEAARPRH